MIKKIEDIISTSKYYVESKFKGNNKLGEISLSVGIVDSLNWSMGSKSIFDLFLTIKQKINIDISSYFLINNKIYEDLKRGSLNTIIKFGNDLLYIIPINYDNLGDATIFFKNGKYIFHPCYKKHIYKIKCNDDFLKKI